MAEKRDVCRKTRGGGEELIGQYICGKCIKDVGDIMGGLTD